MPRKLSWSVVVVALLLPTHATALQLSPLSAAAAHRSPAAAPPPTMLANAVTNGLATGSKAHRCPSAAPPPTMLANAVTNGLATGSKFCLNVKLAVKAERRDEFIQCIRNNQKGTLSEEALAIEYVWGESSSEPNTFHFYEKYEGRVGFEAHQKTEHFQAWEVFASSDPFTSPPVVEFYEEM